MLKNKFNDIFHNIQQNVSSHQKYRQILLNLYKEVPSEDFEIELMRCIELVFCRDITPKNVYVNRSLEFIGSFVGSVMNEGVQLDANTTINNVFLENILTNIICYHNLDNVAVRFHCCQLIHLLFSSLGENVLIDSELWDLVSDPLLERLKDVKPNIRVQAAQALSRFQLPNDPTCKVVSAFVDRLYDINASVRKEIVHLIAPTKLTFPKIAERVRDTDYGVRLVAFRKCATVGPKVFMINIRQSILMNGFNERHNVVKIYFQQELVPSWLDSYNGDFLKFLDALKLDSSEEDIKHSEIVCNHVLLLFFKSHQLGTIIEKFPLDENKVIPMDKLNYQSSLLWYCLVDYLRNLDNSEDHLDLIIPELTLFCAYIERVVDENCKVDGWKFYEHQHNLLQLFKIAKTYDFSDEVGRKCLRKLVIDLLTTKKLSERVTLTMISILSLINPNLDLLTTDICHIISEISEPMVVQTQPTENEIMQRNYQLAQLNVRINELKENSEDALLKQDYQEAAKIKAEIEIIQKKHDELTNEFNKQAARPVFNEVDVTVRCLDILIGMLSLPKLKTLTISLRTCKDEFLPPLFDLDNNEINYKLFKCLSLFCTLDKAVAQQYLKLMCTPLFLYRITPHENMQNLLVSIATISDLLRLFGVELLKNDSLDDSATNKSSRHRHNGTRRLYTIEQSGATESIDDLITSDNIFDILLELLDDEQPELRHQAARALSELVMAKITLSPTIISKMILKWLLSALEEREEVKLQQIIGNALYYLMKIEGGGEIYERTVIPVLNCIGNAPRTSPVADIDIENAVTFLGALTSVQSETQFVNIHKNLAYSLCYKIRDKVDDKNVPLYIRMLVSLHLDLDNPCNMRELIDQVEGILEKITDKMSKKYLEKFLLHLKQMLKEQETKNEEASPNERTSDENEKDKENSSVNHQIENSNENLETVDNPASITKKGRRGISQGAENIVQEISDQRKSSRQLEDRPSLITELVTSVRKSLQSQGDQKKPDQRKSSRQQESHKSLVGELITTSKKQLQGKDHNREKSDQRKTLRQSEARRLLTDLVTSPKNSLRDKGDDQEKSPQRKSLRQSENPKSLVDFVTSPKNSLWDKGHNQGKSLQKKSLRQLENPKSLVDIVTSPKNNLRDKGDNQEKSPQRKSLRQPESRKALTDFVTSPKNGLRDKGDNQEKSPQRKSLRQPESCKSLADFVTSPKNSLRDRDDNQKKSSQKKSLKQPESRKSLADIETSPKNSLPDKGDNQNKSSQKKSLRQPESRKSLADIVTSPKNRLRDKSDNQGKSPQRKSLRQPESRKSLTDFVTSPKNSLQNKRNNQDKSPQRKGPKLVTSTKKGDQFQSNDGSNNRKKQLGSRLATKSLVEKQGTVVRKNVRQAKGDADLNPPTRKHKRNKEKVRRLGGSDSVSSTQSSVEELNPRKSLRLSQNSIVMTPSPKSLELNSKKLSQPAKNNSVNTSNREPKSTRKSSNCTNHVNIPRVRSSERLGSKTPRNVLNSSIESDTPQVKRRKKRGKLVGNSITSIGNRYSDETILHTILYNNEIELEKLEDDDEDNMSILTPTTTESQSSKSSIRSSTRSSTRGRAVTLTETSSDSESPLRKSSRKIKINSNYYSDSGKRKNHRKI